MKRKLTIMVDIELIKEFKMYAAGQDVTMSSLITKAIADILNKGNEHSLKSINIKEITQKEREDISTVDTVLPIKDLTEV